MFENITPLQAGSTSADILEFMQIIDEYCPGMHSVILARGGKIFHECYYAPFHKDYLHRMYSVTKSFVSVAIGLLIEDGKLQLTDRIVDLLLGDSRYLLGYSSSRGNSMVYCSHDTHIAHTQSFPSCFCIPVCHQKQRPHNPIFR